MKSGRPWWTLFAAVLGGAMVGLDGTATTIAAPYISESVGGSLGQLELIANAYLVALAIGLLPAGRLADRYGRRKIFTIGVLGFGAASLAFALSTSVWSLILFRVLQGLAGALLQASALALVRNAFPATKLGIPLGIWGGANALAIGLGPVLAGVIVQHWQWPAVFAVNAPVALLVVGMVFFAVTESIGERKGSPLAPRRPLRGLLANRAVFMGSILIAMSSFGVFALLFLLTLYLQNVHGMAPAKAGAWMLPPTCAVVLSAPIGGIMAQKLGPRWPVFIGFVLVAVGLLGLSTLHRDSGFNELLYPGVMAGFGIGLCMIAATEAVMGAAQDNSIGTASALQQMASQIGGVLGIASIGAVLSWQVSLGLPIKLEDAQLPKAAQDILNAGADRIAQGATPAGFEPTLGNGAFANAARVISELSFTDAMGVALLIAASVSLVGAVLAFWLPQPEKSASAGGSPKNSPDDSSNDPPDDSTGDRMEDLTEPPTPQKPEFIDPDWDLLPHHFSGDLIPGDLVSPATR